MNRSARVVGEITPIGIALLGVAGSLAATMEPRQQGGPPPVASPPPAAWARQASIAPAPFEPYRLVGDVRVSTLAKRVTIQWSYDDAGTGERAFAWDDFDVSFWPTAAARIDVDGLHLLVAGKRPSNSRTVIELWTLDLVSLPDENTDATVAKSTVYDANQQGKRVVRFMDPMPGTAQHAILQFDDSRDLYSLDASTGVFQVIYTVQQVPKLGLDSLSRLWTAEHPTAGFVYGIEDDASVSDDGGVLLYDSDKDGDLDSWEDLEPADWDEKVGNVPWVQQFPF
jgi:hypothetical protein